MRRFLRTWSGRRLLGLSALLAAAGFGAWLGATLGARRWPLYAGVTGMALLLFALADRRLARRRAAQSSPHRSKQQAAQGGQAAYDLEKDTSTDGQRYLM